MQSIGELAGHEGAGRDSGNICTPQQGMLGQDSGLCAPTFDGCRLGFMQLRVVHDLG